MYEQISKDSVLAELNNDSRLYCVDISTLRVMPCDNMSLSAIKNFIAKSQTLFIKVLANG